MSGPSLLLERVRQTRRRALGFGLLRCGAAACVALLLAPLVSTPLLGWLPRDLEVWAVAACTAGGVLLAAVAIRRQWRRAAPRLSAAAAVTALAGDGAQHRELFLTGADLATWGEDGAAVRGASPGLTRSQVELAERAARRLEPAAAVPARPVLGWSAAALCLLALALLWGQLDPLGAATAWGRVLRGGDPDPITVGNLELRYVPPAYTELPARHVPASDGAVRGYRGSQVTLTGRLSRAVDSGSWRGPDGRQVPLQMDGAGFRVTWVLDRPGSYGLDFLAGERPVPSDFLPRPVEVLEDRRPSSELTLPAGDLEVTSDQQVEVTFSAHDDFRVERVELVLQGEEEVRIEVNARAGERIDGRAVFLPLLYPQLGEGAQLRVDAWDGDQVSGPKVGSSRTVYVAFLDKRRLVADIQGLEERLFEALLTHLGDHLEWPADEQSGQRLRAKAEDLLQLLERLAERVRQAADEGALGALAVLQIEGGLHAALGPFVAGVEDRAPVVREVERDVLFLDQLLQALRAEEALAVGDELTALQRSLFDDLQAGASLEDLQQRLDQVEQLLRDMMERLMRAPAEMPDAFANADAVQNMPSSELQDTLEQLREALERGDRDAARELAEQLLETLSAWMAALEEAAQGAAQSQFDPMLQELAELQAETRELAAGQERLLQDTQARSAAASERALAELQAELDQFLALQEQRLQEIEQAARDMQRLESPSGFHGGMRPRQPGAELPPVLESLDARRRVFGAAEEVRQGLRRDLAQARDGAQILEEALQSLRDSVAEGLDQDPARQAQLEARAAAAEAQLQALRADLDGLANRRLEGLTAEERTALEQLGQRQQELAERTESLAEQVAEAAARIPLLPPQAAERAGSAGQAMRGAGERLGQGDPYGAVPQETRALENLSELSQDLEGAMQQMSEGMQQGGMQMVRRPGGRSGGQEVDRSPVEIPKEAEARELRRFREEVLRAMRGGQYPEEYEQEIKQYYERLIR